MYIYGTVKATHLAKYIIAKCDNVGDCITNKKLQKILYYVKAWGLVYFTDGVIEDDFEAWIHGPVCREVYYEYKHFGYSPLSIDYEGFDSSSEYLEFFKRGMSIREGEKMELVDAVFNKYAVLSSLELELLSHSEEPWIQAREGLTPVETGNNVIDENLMLKYYTSLLDEEVERS